MHHNSFGAVGLFRRSRLSSTGRSNPAVPNTAPDAPALTMLEIELKPALHTGYQEDGDVDPEILAPT